MVVKNVVNKIIIGLIGIVIGFFICFFTINKKPVEKIKIVKQTETEFKYITKAVTLDDFRNCYNSKLDILCSTREDNWIDIIAKDKCKLAKKSIKIAPEERNNFLYTNIGIKSVQVNYYKKFGNYMLGGGVSYPLNIYIGVGYNF